MARKHRVSLVDEMPEIEIEGEHFRIRLADGRRFAIPMRIMGPAVEEISRLKMQWDGRAQIAVIPLCELCIRHNLPRDPH